MKTGLNPAAIRFSITPDAKEYLRELLIKFPSQARPVLMMTTVQTDGQNPSYHQVATPLGLWVLGAFFPR